MKLLVFAHTPPPHHGQSYMVQLMLAGFGGDCRHRTGRAQVEDGQMPPDLAAHDIRCYHVNARLSKRLEEIGDVRFSKLLLVVWYCLQAIWCRVRFGVSNFYYIPAPGKRSALYRDWVVLAVCRPFFKHLILHWHGSGLAKWLETSAQIRTRSLTYSLMRSADLSIVLSNYGRGDAEKQLPARVEIVGNGIPDPCPEFEQKLLPRRQGRLQARKLLLAGREVPAELGSLAGPDPRIYRVLFLAHCTRSKGLFEAVEGALLAHKRLAAAGSPLFLKLQVAGQFVLEREEAEFRDLCATAAAGVVDYLGYVVGDRKRVLFEEADCFLFPSHLESFGLVLVEAMAFGLPIVTTRCGALPEVMPPNSGRLVDVENPGQIAEALIGMLTEAPFERLRQRYETSFTLQHHLATLAAALRSADPEHDRRSRGEVRQG